LRAQRAASEANAEAVALDYAYARQSLAATTAKLWYLCVEARQVVALNQRAVTIYGDLLSLVQLRRSAGKDSDLDVVDVRAKLETAGIKFAETRTGDESFLEWALRTRRGANVVVQSGNIGYICATGSIRGPVDRVFAKITQTAPGPCPAFNDPVDPIALGLTEGELTPFGSAHIYCFEMVPDASVRATNHIRILAVVEVDGVLRSRGCKDNTFEGNADGETDCEAGPSLCD
jgi:hypothetical protein